MHMIELTWPSKLRLFVLHWVNVILRISQLCCCFLWTFNRCPMVLPTLDMIFCWIISFLLRIFPANENPTPKALNEWMISKHTYHTEQKLWKVKEWCIIIVVVVVGMLQCQNNSTNSVVGNLQELSWHVRLERNKNEDDDNDEDNYDNNDDCSSQASITVGVATGLLICNPVNQQVTCLQKKEFCTSASLSTTITINNGSRLQLP